MSWLSHVNPYVGSILIGLLGVLAIARARLGGRHPSRGSGRFSPEYIAYIDGPIWAARSRAYRSAHPRCEWRRCLNTAEQTHHKRYGAFDGREPDSWLMSVCRKHHPEADRQRRAMARGISR